MNERNGHGGETGETKGRREAVTRLVAAAPPPSASHALGPDRIEFYVRSAMHQDRTPGNVLVVLHPGKLYKVPRDLFAALKNEGYNLVIVETQPDRLQSVTAIRDGLVQVAQDGKPLDVMVISGDGSLDHHVLVAAYWAFYPELVQQRSGEISCQNVSAEDLEKLPKQYRATFFEHLPDGASLDPTEEVIKQIWLLRGKLESALRAGKSTSRILRKAQRSKDDLMLQVAILATLFPDKVALRPHGFDLSKLVNTSQEKTFQGLFPFIRCISTYPAGTAADNAVFAGVPGWGFGLLAGVLTKVPLLGALRRFFEKRVTRAFVDYFLRDGVVVPARLSFVALDGEWQRLSSHAAGGPGAGRFFSADLTSKTKGMLGYLKRIPRVIIEEAIFGKTIVRIRSLFANGQQKSFTEAQLTEGVYTNRTFIAGVGSIPTTDPTSFAGQSSLSVVQPIWSRNQQGHRVVSLRGLAVFTEAIVKGILARALHVAGLGVGTLAGGGKFFFLPPEHQVAIKEGEQIQIDYMNLDRSPRAVPVQVSGDPFQAYRMDIRVAWGPIPLLCNHDSLLLAATKRSLAHVRLQQSYRLQGVYIGGIHYFRHHVGRDWDADFVDASGLLRPPHHLPRTLVVTQRQLMESWQDVGAGDFVDTTESGLELWRRGRYAHNNDQSAHLLILKEAQGTLLVRQVLANESGEIYENRSHYQRVGGFYIIYSSQTRVWRGDDAPSILQEDHYFRDAEAFQQDAPTFFPVVARSPEEPTLLAGKDSGDLKVGEGANEE